MKNFGLSVDYNASFRNRLRSELRKFLANRPSIYIPLKKLQSKIGIVNHRTEIVIEGYPRCANSFAEAAFRVAQDREVEIAHHTHAPAQVFEGIKRNIPILIVFREPDDAVISRMVRNENLTPRDAYREYIWFYENIWPVIDKCVLSSFEKTTGAFGKVIRSINVKYGTDFCEFDHHDPLMIEKTKNLIDGLSVQRIGRKTQYAQENKEPYHANDRKMQKELWKERVKGDELKEDRRTAREICEKLKDKENYEYR